MYESKNIIFFVLTMILQRMKNIFTSTQFSFLISTIFNDGMNFLNLNSKFTWIKFEKIALKC